MVSNSIFLNEIKRKLIHLSSATYPILYLFTNKSTMLNIIWILLIIVLAWDLLRINNIKLPFLQFFYKILRKKETENKKFTGAFWMLLAFLIVIAFFSKHIAVLSMFVVIICDTGASLFGIKYGGKLSIAKNYFGSLHKSAEGFIMFIMLGFVLIYAYSSFININALYLVIPIILTAIVELYSNKLNLDDNFIVTIAFALFSYLAVGSI